MIKGYLRRAGIIDRRGMKGFLRNVEGVIHVGAHIGQERDLYAQYGLNVLWVEPLPHLFARLEQNIANLPRQRALQALVTDQDDREYDFHIASNDGGSSSILKPGKHLDVWPDISFPQTVKLRSRTLPRLLIDEGVDPGLYDALVMDTQGSELLVLTGAEELLGGFDYVKTEAADFEAYESCCTIADLDAFLSARGFRESARKPIARHRDGGGYYDLVYARVRR